MTRVYDEFGLFSAVGELITGDLLKELAVGELPRGVVGALLADLEEVGDCQLQVTGNEIAQKIRAYIEKTEIRELREGRDRFTPSTEEDKS